MDPFAEKDLIELLKSIAFSMKEIKDELFDIKIAIKELNLEEEDFEDEGDEEGEIEEDGRLVKGSVEIIEKEPVEKFSVAEEDSYIEIEPNKKFEEDDALDSEDEPEENSGPLF